MIVCILCLVELVGFYLFIVFNVLEKQLVPFAA